jgi:hypothetical protein
MNVPLLRKIQKVIDKNPSRFLMRAFKSDFDGNTGIAHPCGTAYCIAGWALELTGRHFTPGEDSVMDLAGTALKIPMTHYLRLFDEGSWPPEFQTSNRQADPNEELSGKAVARIERFISTGGEQ